jgi:hypothetical protein
MNYNYNDDWSNPDVKETKEPDLPEPGFFNLSLNFPKLILSKEQAIVFLKKEGIL